MDKQEPPFNTQAYANYVALLKEKEDEWNEFVLNKTPPKTQNKMTSNNTKELKECQQLCKDLDYLIIQDSSIREEIIDEYVYLLSNRRIEEMQGYVNTELGSDY